MHPRENEEQYNFSTHLRPRIHKYKEKIVIRKFGYAFLRKVHGNVLPSQCSKFYEKKLKRYTFVQWKIYWWSHRVEWKLYVHANYFCRLSILRNAFYSWKKYVHMKERCKKIVAKAHNHYNGRLLKRCFQELKSYCKVMATERRIATLIQQIFMFISIRRKLLYWRSNVLRNELAMTSNMLSTTFSRHKGLRKYFNLWIKIVQLKKVMRNKFEIAIRFNEKRTKQTTFRMWWKYLERRRTKQQFHILAEAVFTESSQKHFFTLWKEKFQAKLKENKLLQKAQICSQKMLLKGTFHAWTRHIKHKKYQYHILIKAHIYWSLKTKMSAIYCWKLYVYKRRMFRTKCLKANEHHDCYLLKFAWRKWTSYVEEMDNTKILPQLKRVSDFHRKKLLMKFMKNLRLNIQYQKQKYQLKKKYECACLIRSLLIWWDRWQMILYDQQLERQASAFHQMSCLKHILCTWQAKLYEVQHLKQQEKVAYYHQREKILSSCLYAWHKWTQKRIQKIKMLAEAELWHKEKLQYKSFHCWMFFYVEKKKKQYKYLIAESKSKELQKRKAFRMLVMYHKMKQVPKCQAEIFSNMRSLKKKRKVFLQWQSFTRAQIARKQKVTKTILHYQKQLLTSGMKQWLSYTQYRFQKKKSQQHLVQKHQQQVNDFRAKMYLCYWRFQFVDAHQKMQTVCNHHHKKLTKKYFTIWHFVHSLQLIRHQRKENLTEKGKTLMLKRWIQLWNQQYQAYLAVKQKNVAVLLLWSTTLVRKCFKKWTEFTKHRHQKQDRYEQAELIQHINLLKEGIVLWICTANSYARQQEMKALTHAFDCHFIIMEGETAGMFEPVWKEEYEGNDVLDISEDELEPLHFVKVETECGSDEEESLETPTCSISPDKLSDDDVTQMSLKQSVVEEEGHTSELKPIHFIKVEVEDEYFLEEENCAQSVDPQGQPAADCVSQDNGEAKDNSLKDNHEVDCREVIEEEHALVKKQTESIPGMSFIKRSQSEEVNSERNGLKGLPKIKVREKRYKCHICAKCFSKNSNLTTHMVVHTGERPYSCSQCNKDFSIRSNLKRHFKTHTEERPYECKLCSKKFSESCKLKRHLLTHTREKPHKCHLCDKSFTQISNLKSHLITHADPVTVVATMETTF